jgi:hypothetical protein
LRKRRHVARKPSAMMPEPTTVASSIAVPMNQQQAS